MFSDAPIAPHRSLPLPDELMSPALRVEHPLSQVRLRARTALRARAQREGPLDHVRRQSARDLKSKGEVGGWGRGVG